MTEAWNKKLSDADVLDIVVRREEGEPIRDLAEEYGITKAYAGALGRTARVTPVTAVPVLADGFNRRAADVRRGPRS